MYDYPFFVEILSRFGVQSDPCKLHALQTCTPLSQRIVAILFGNNELPEQILTSKIWDLQTINVTAGNLTFGSIYIYL